MTNTFSQRHGFRAEAEPVPFDQVPEKARIRFREALDKHGESLVGHGEGYPTLLRRLAHHIGQHPPIGSTVEGLNELAYRSEWVDFFDLCEKVIELAPSGLKAQVESEMNQFFAESGICWWAEGGRLTWRGGTPLFTQSVRTASSLLTADTRFQGPLQQFENSWKCLSSRPPDVANCMKDAIGAVEGVARITEGSKQILSRLLDPMARRLGIHPALREAIGKLYAYRGDEQGITHGATQPLTVGIEEAELVLHWSASAIVYLLRKSAP